MFSKRLVHSTVLMGAFALAGMSLTGASAVSASTEADNIKQFQTFVTTHSDDYAGRDALAMKLFGHHEYVTFGQNSQTFTGTEAAARISQSKATSSTVGPVTNSIPDDAFSVSKSVTDAGSNYVVTGTWNFRDSWAGTSDPRDLAALEFDMSSCHKFSSYAASTTNENGTSTKLATLRDGGASTKAPIWNINDYESGFVSQADHGAVSVAISQGSCSKPAQIGYQFQYEANQGGGLVSVSVGYGFINASYSGSSYDLQKSTTAGYFTR